MLVHSLCIDIDINLLLGSKQDFSKTAKISVNFVEGKVLFTAAVALFPVSPQYHTAWFIIIPLRQLAVVFYTNSPDGSESGDLSHFHKVTKANDFKVNSKYLTTFYQNGWHLEMYSIRNNHPEHLFTVQT